MGFMGYRRPDGSSGIRNYVAVISSVSCANGTVNAIARAVPKVKPITHTEGCGRGPADVIMATRTLVGLGKNPNVAAVLIIGLGCEVIKSELLAAAISESKKPVEVISIQEGGGSKKAARKGIETVKKLLSHADSIKHEPVEWNKLVMGVECGGSDGMSGITANPMVGVAADWLVGEGGTVILSETTEMIGTEAILEKRAANPALGKRLTELITNQHKLAQEVLGAMANMVISPGNMDGGISTIEEKSLGCIIKGGTTTIQELLDYSEEPTKKGLVIMDTPGSDIFSLTAMAAGGAQIFVFTTGRGTPAGFPIVPVIKIATNSELFEKMSDDMDINAGTIIDGESINKAGKKLVRLIRRVANGKRTKAEINKNDILSIHTTGPSF